MKMVLFRTSCIVLMTLISPLQARTTQLPQTVQMTCWDVNDGFIPCDRTGQDKDSMVINSCTEIGSFQLTMEASKNIETTFIKASSGHSHSLALKSDGTVMAWGYNAQGQLGNNSYIDSFMPIIVIGLNGKTTSITAGANHSVALLSDGTVKAWGSNGSGELGIGIISSSIITPVEVSSLGGHVSAVAAGNMFTTALMSDGTVKAWGENSSGQLGNGTYNNSSTPVSVSGLGGPVTAIVAGDNHTVVLMADGTVKTWGLNSSGQLGDGTLNNSSTPVSVTGLEGPVTTIAAGENSTILMMADGTVKTLGSD